MPLRSSSYEMESVTWVQISGDAVCVSFWVYEFEKGKTASPHDRVEWALKRWYNRNVLEKKLRADISSAPLKISFVSLTNHDGQVEYIYIYIYIYIREDKKQP